MSLSGLLETTTTLSTPPAGSVNVRVGRAVEGPGGRWIPCATQVAGGRFVPGLFQVGPGRSQVCRFDRDLPSPEAAFSEAIELAACAAA